MTNFAPEDFGKTYRIRVEFDGVPAGQVVDLGWAGVYQNMNTYDVDQERVTRFEMGCRVPFFILEVPASCELIVAE